MERRELDFILQEGEGQKIEFKEAFSSGLNQDFVAFANAQGGRIFLGVGDNNQIVGIKVTNRLKSQIRDLARNCDPSVSISLEEVGNVLVVRIPEGLDKPYRCSSGFYLRQGPNSQKLIRDEIMDFAIGEGKIRFDERINSRFSYPDDFDEIRLKRFLNIANLSLGMDVKNILLNLDIASKREDGGLDFKNAGVLFFAKEPQRFFRHSAATAVLYKGEDKRTVLDRKNLIGDPITIVEDAETFLKKNIRLSYEFSGGFQREERYEYPIEALREAVINAVMHRDYFIKGSEVMIELYANRIEVTSPGGLPKGMRMEDLGKRGIRRNPLIADLFYRAGYVERIGSGINKMNGLMEEWSLDRPRFETNGFFVVTFLGPSEVEIKVDISKHELNERQIKALNYLQRTGKLTNRAYRELNDVSKNTAYLDIEDLRAKGLIKQKGSGPQTHYVLISNDRSNDAER